MIRFNRLQFERITQARGKREVEVSVLRCDAANQHFDETLFTAKCEQKHL